ncbi:Chromatin remodeling factor mit1 [Colletotrichum truncatum]|uniref:Chromatin remodeling factor mit1 n=1 Tax=Colletotrichum truncatum TaxID=5467 RepID=A0ACC3YCR3_COLTU
MDLAAGLPGDRSASSDNDEDFVSEDEEQDTDAENSAIVKITKGKAKNFASPYSTPKKASSNKKQQVNSSTSQKKTLLRKSFKISTATTYRVTKASQNKPAKPTPRKQNPKRTPKSSQAKGSSLSGNFIPQQTLELTRTEEKPDQKSPLFTPPPTFPRQSSISDSTPLPTPDKISK